MPNSIFGMIDHLESRKCNIRLYPGTGIGPNSAQFPLYNFGGKRTGFIAYNPEGPKKVQNNERGKYYTYITKGEIGVFGIESLSFSGPIILVGGLFKATALHRLGYTALHVSSVSPKNLRAQLQLMRRKFFAIGDNDPEGEQFVRRWGGFQSPVDVDEMTYLEILEMLNERGI